MKTSTTKIYFAVEPLEGVEVTEFEVKQGWLKYGTAREWTMVPMSEVTRITYTETVEKVSNEIDRSKYHKLGQAFPPTAGPVSDED